ncbi:MAG TPA: DUF6492 family protein, partial [Stellaceae bacterium]|nr:DUF6492 family protein [Stellaceae bacterium]
MDAVLPLKLYGDWNDHDLTRARILCFSLRRFWAGEAPLCLHVIARDAERGTVEQGLAEFAGGRLAIEVVAETALVPTLAEVPGASGWYRQQVIKLAAHRLVAGWAYLTLDADVVCIRRIDESTLLPDGRILTDWERRVLHADWWEASASLLGVLPGLDGVGLKPTPAILSTAICQRLESWLDGIGGWAGLLVRTGWTEYTLYNLFADRHGLTAVFHAGETDERRGLLRAHYSFSSRAEFEQWKPERAMAPDGRGCFIVCNSSARVDPAEIWARLGPCFGDEVSFPALDGRRFLEGE